MSQGWVIGKYPTTLMRMDIPTVIKIGITKHWGKKWGGNSVYSVLKRHKERETRLEYMRREYEPEWGK